MKGLLTIGCSGTGFFQILLIYSCSFAPLRKDVYQSGRIIQLLAEGLIGQAVT